MKMKILLIDDEAALVENFSFLISYKRPHVEVVPAYNGQEALSLVEQDSFDLIISDIKMPLLDGFELKKELNKRKIETPLVFLSGLAVVDAAVISRQVGAFGFLLKPLTGDELTSAIDRAEEYNRRIKPKQEYLNPIAELVIQCVGSSYPVTKLLSSDYFVGRSLNADIRLSSGRCSREHALLTRTQESLLDPITAKNHYTLIDYSRNGLLLNGNRVVGYAFLSHGDTIEVPDYRMKYFVLTQKGKINPFTTL